MVSLLAEPFIARFFAPDVYGPGMIFATIIITFSPVMFLRYNFAIVQATDKREAANLLVLCLIIFIALVSISSVLLYAFPQISIKLINFDISHFIIYFVLAIFFTSITFLMKYWFSYKKIFYLLTINTLIIQISAVIILIVVGGLGYRNVESYIFARTVSFVIGPSVFIWFFIKNDFRKVCSYLSKQQLLQAIIKYKNFPLYEYWGFLAALILIQVPLFMLSKFWGTTATGLYAKAYAILGLFSLTISDSVNRVFHREIAGRIQEGIPMEEFIINLIKSIIKIIIIPFTLMLLIGSEIFYVFLGARWEEAGTIGGILVPWLFFSIISISIRSLYNLFNKQKIYTLITFMFLFSWCSVFIVCHLLGLTVIHTLIIFSSFAALCFVVEISYLMYLIHLDYKVVLMFLGRKILQIMPLILLNYVMGYLKITNFYVLFSVNGLLSLIYLYYYIFKDPLIISIFRDKIIKK